MSILFLLIPLAIIFLIMAVAFFFWAIKRGQYDDMQSQALRVVIDDHQSMKVAADNKTQLENDEQLDADSDKSADKD